MKKFLKKQEDNTLLQHQKSHSKMRKLTNLTNLRQHSEKNKKTRQNKCKEKRHSLKHAPKGREILYSKVLQRCLGRLRSY